MNTPGRQAIVESLVRKVADGSPVVEIGRSKYRVGDGATIHVRLHRPIASSSRNFWFDLNPSSLSVDYDIWICGNASMFYVVPQDVIARLYDDPEHYRNKRHPQIHPVHVYVETHEVRFARLGKREQIAKFFNGTVCGRAS